MRRGVNPAKRYGAEAFKQPTPLTITTVTHIPTQTGYFRECLDVLRLCLSSIRAHTPVEFDLMVFDNGSCREVRDFLTGELEAKRIDYLIFSPHNVGKVGAWNHLFSAARGELVTYTDSDVYFYPGWFESMKKVLDAFPRASHVAGCGAPQSVTSRDAMAEALRLAEADTAIKVERGQLLSDEHILEYAESIGKEPGEYLAKCRSFEHYRFTREEVSAYPLHSHLHFLARTTVLKQLVPFDSSVPFAGGDAQWDLRLMALSYMQLSVCKPVAYHLGNVLTPRWRYEAQRLGVQLSGNATHRHRRGGFVRPFLRVPLMRGAILRLHDLLFDIATGKNQK